MTRMDRDGIYRYAQAQYLRTKGDFWLWLTDQMDADAAALEASQAREAATAKEAQQLRETIDWNLSQYERWRAEKVAQHDASIRRIVDAEDRLRKIGARVIEAQRARRKTVRLADLMGDDA